MKSRGIILLTALLGILNNSALANRQLETKEILQIFKTLTDQPRFAWIPYGTIQAQHQEYNLQHGYASDSSVIVKYDGNRFYWEINTNSIDTIQADSKDQSTLQDGEDYSWSKKRIFAWDGQQYTMYFGPGKQAIVTEDTDEIPVEINGPLTAGVIPWGLGICTYESLSAAELSAVELEVDGQTKIYLELSMPRIPEMHFTLDPAREHAVLSYSLVTDEGLYLEYNCSDYELVSEYWIPHNILIEKYDNNKNPARLFSRDIWNVTSVNISTPPLSDFDVSYDKGTLVQRYLEMFQRPFSYHHSESINTDDLFHESMLNTFREDSQSQNCATAALKYAASKCNKEIADSNLAQLIAGPDETTSLYSMKEFVQQQGLHCLAVRTDIKRLKNLKDNYQVILHFPQTNHYVVLQDIDDKYAWLIDLNRKHFFYRKKIKNFDIDWGEGTALLVSKDPVNIQPDISTISDDDLHNIIGSDGFGNYSCSKLIQQGDVVFCPPILGGLCMGQYSWYFTLYACEPDESGGTCTGEPMLSRSSIHCVNDPFDLSGCIIPGDWRDYYIRACQQ
ncbi:MAG: cysteine peptidase family C39 domain-containing protein [Planctomycetota bacterium]|jgi:hypothetical protein